MLPAVGVALAVALPAAAQATLATSKPVALDAPNNGNAPLVLYDAVGSTTFIAWNNPQGDAGGIDLCVLADGNTGCSGGGPTLLNVTSAENSIITGTNVISLGGLVELANGDVVVIGQAPMGGSVAWESAASGSAFTGTGQGLQHAGKFISPVNLFYAFGNVASLGDSDVALLDDYNDYFSDSPFAGPETPASLGSKNVNQGNDGRYTRKALYSSGAEIAAEPAPAPAVAGDYLVVGVGDNSANGSPTITACGTSSASGYSVSVGSVGGTASGSLNRAGLPAYSLLACSAEAPVVATGTDGIGVLEEEGDGVSGAGSTFTIDYRHFNATATGGSFGSPVELTSASDVADDLDVVTDSGTGVYAMWDGEHGIRFDYSPDGGVHWDGPVSAPYLSADGDEISQSDPMIAGVGGGELAFAYDQDIQGTNPDVNVQTFVQYVDALPTPKITSKQKSGRTSASNISITAGTVGETDKATLSNEAPTAGGKLTYALYANASCTTPKRVYSGVETVKNGAVPASGKVTRKLRAGTYYWKLSYSGDSNDQPSVTKCGAEKLTVKKATRRR